MSHLHLKSNFKLSNLSMALSIVSLLGCVVLPSMAYALEALDDDGLAATTGEGIAFLPENASIRLNGADTNNSGAGTFDTGYIRLIPVGPLTKESQDTNKDGDVNASDRPVGKADIFLYGLAISQSNKDYGVARTSTDWNSRFGRNIDSWGSAINPWLLKVTTEQNVPNFSALNPQDTGKGDVSYLMLEAPLYHADTDNNFTNGINAGINILTPAEKSAYNLKLGLWSDIFVRDPKVIENMAATGTQFDLGGAGRENRLRLQAVWDGFSLNGTNVKIFQTLGGATNTGGMSTFYNNTLGIAGVVRLNGGDGQTLRATYTAAQRVEDTNWVNSDTTAYGCGNASLNFGVASCEYRFRSKSLTDSVSNGSWTAPSVQSVLRLSTRETADTGLLTTPAINGGVAPTFDPNEGLYLYNLNINLVLGSLYQPLTVGVAPDGKNITFEIARIPNKESIYKQVYTNYADKNPTTNGGYYGSTCNIYQCGTSTVAGYQGSNATHSSISIGSTEYNSATNSLSAHKGNGAIGISFGALTNRSGINLTKSYTRWQDQQRQARVRTYNYDDTYDLGGGLNPDKDPYRGDDCGFFGCNNRVSSAPGYHVDWAYRKSGDSNTGIFNNTDGTYTLAELQAGDNNGNDDLGITGRPAKGDNLNWDLAGRAPNWADATAKSVAVRGVVLDNIPTAASLNMSSSDNFGSAVIDGLLIQHMKITTKGL